MFDREAKLLERGVHAAFRSAVVGTQKLFVDAHEVVEKGPNLIFGHSTRAESAKPELLSAHSVSRAYRQSQTRAASNIKVRL